MSVRTFVAACVVVLLPAAAAAQTLTGLAEMSVGTGSGTTAGQPQQNTSFWQGYALGFSSPLFSPKFLKLDTEVSFRSGRMSFMAPDSGQEGKQSDLGYRLGASLFPSGHFPFTFQATRDSVAESGNYPSLNGIRGGIVIPPGEPMPEFHTVNTSLSMGWQLAVPNLPRIDIGYHTGDSVVNGGPFRGEQRDDELHAGITKDTAGTHQSLTYQRNAYESPLSQAFNQRLDNIDYDFSATPTPHLRTSTRIGRRSYFSLFEVPSVAAGGQPAAYTPPVRGQIDSVYVVSSVSYQPSQRFAFDLSGSLNRDSSAGVTTDARVATGSARVEVLPGLSVSAIGTFGDRGQVVGNVPITVLSRSGVAGVTYRAGLRWLQGSVGYTGGMGWNTTPEGRSGAARSDAEQANLSVSFLRVDLGGGYERSRNHDDILDFGNFAIDRGHASIRSQLGPIQLNGSWDDARVERGRGATFSTNLQQTMTGSASVRLGRNSQLTANVGAFRNDGSFGRDHAAFAGLALDAQLATSLRFSAWIRRTDTVATLTGLNQMTLYGFAQLEYRLRQFDLALEARLNNQDLVIVDLADQFHFRGHQILLRISRKFGRHF